MSMAGMSLTSKGLSKVSFANSNLELQAAASKVLDSPGGRDRGFGSDDGLTEIQSATMKSGQNFEFGLTKMEPKNDGSKRRSKDWKGETQDMYMM